MTGDFDANGDGLADFAAQSSDGSYLVVSGRAARFGTTIDASSIATIAPPCAMDPTDLWAVNDAGDSDGDGHDDLAIGYLGCGATVGVLFGAFTSRTFAAGAHTWTGNAASTLGQNVLQNGDVDGDGYADTLITHSDNTTALRILDLAYGGPR